MKKIMFNDKCLLTQAVLEGRKTQTRRIAQRKDIVPDVRRFPRVYPNAKYKVGEEVAVAQNYDFVYTTFMNHECYKSIYPKAWEIIKKMYESREVPEGWHNKMFTKPDLMPHRIKITNVRVERLQDISAEDCLKEGIKRKNERYCVENYKGVCFYTNDPILAFRYLIDKTCGKGTWKSNPWVFVYDFELIR